MSIDDEIKLFSSVTCKYNPDEDSRLTVVMIQKAFTPAFDIITAAELGHDADGNKIYENVVVGRRGLYRKISSLFSGLEYDENSIVNAAVISDDNFAVPVLEAPREEWIEHNGVKPELFDQCLEKEIRIRKRSGDRSMGKVKEFNWIWDQNNFGNEDVIAYLIVTRTNEPRMPKHSDGEPIIYPAGSNIYY